MAVHDGAGFLTELDDELLVDVPETTSALINIIGNFNGTIEVTGSTLLSDMANVWGARNVSPDYTTNLITNDGSDVEWEFRIATGGQAVRLKMTSYTSGIAGVRVTATHDTIVVEGPLAPNAATEATLLSMAATLFPRDVLLDVSGSYTYIGKSATGGLANAAVWQISRLDETTEDIGLRYADGVSTFTKVWNDRASYSY